MNKIKCSGKPVKLSELRPHPKNPNTHPKRQIELLAHAFNHLGQRNNVVVSNLSGYIVSGHARLRAARKLGWDCIGVEYQDFKNEREEFEHLVTDNSIADLSELDNSIIAAEALALDITVKEEFESMALSEQAIEEIEKEINAALKDDKKDDDEPKTSEAQTFKAPDVPVTKKGDVWIMGENRLICGDAKSEKDLQDLLAGESAELLLTDPPYGVSYTKKNEFLNGLGKGLRNTTAIENDELKPDETYTFWVDVFKNARNFLAEKSSYYVTSPQGGDLLLLLLLQALKDSGFHLKHSLVWVKNNHVLGRCDYNYKHEPILYGWKNDGTHVFYGRGNYKTSVWEFPKPLKNDLHPTMKPVELWQEALLNSCGAGNIALDIFAGSGTIFLAAERAGVRGYGVEISPAYCDVSVERWQNTTGKTATLESTAKSFNETKLERAKL